MDSHNNNNVCRICRTVDEDKPLKSPCLCTGSIRYVHSECLIEWIKHSGKETCHICNTKYHINRTYASLSILEITKYLISYTVYGISVLISLASWMVGLPLSVNYIFYAFALTQHPFMPLKLSNDVEVGWFWKSLGHGLFQSVLIVVFWMILLSLRDVVLDFLDIQKLRADNDNEVQDDVALPPNGVPDLVPVLQIQNYVADEYVNEMRQQVPAENNHIEELAPVLVQPLVQPNAPALVLEQQPQDDEHAPLLVQLNAPAPVLEQQQQDAAVREHVERMFQDPQPEQDNGPDRVDWAVDDVLGLNGNIFSTLTYQACALGIAFVTVGVFISLPRVIGSIILPPQLKQHTVASLVSGYLFGFVVLIVTYASVEPLRKRYKSLFSALFLGGKVVFLFSIELVVFPIVIGMFLNTFIGISSLIKT